MKYDININITEITSNITVGIQGNTIPVPTKKGYNEKNLVSGRTRIMQTCVARNTTVDVQYCSESDYLALYKIWANNSTVILYTERNEPIKGLIAGMTLNLTPRTDVDGKTFYTGTLEVKE